MIKNSKLEKYLLKLLLILAMVLNCYFLYSCKTLLFAPLLFGIIALILIVLMMIVEKK